MFKPCARTFAVGIACKQNLQSLKSRHREQVYYFSKPKKTKRMLRTWEFTQEARDIQQQESNKQRSLRQYRLISYNILAQDLLVEHCYLYQGINSQHLLWDHRLNCLKNELAYLDPDILCVQEMQFNHVKEFVGRLNEKRKLEYIFKKKTGHKTDGCAIIFDKEKFKLIAEQGIEFFKPSRANLNRENVALLAKFQLRHEPDKHLIIGTTHLLFNPRRHDVRIAQVELLLETLEKFARKNTGTDSTIRYFPVILTGDFNSEPKSPPYNRLTSLYETEIGEKNFESEEDLNHCEGNEHHYQLATKNSQFKLSAVDFGRSSASTFHGRWITVDYILRSVKESDKENEEKSDVKVLSIYKLPTIKNCERVGKIPNQYLGSDHYAQAIEFLVG